MNSTFDYTRPTHSSTPPLLFVNKDAKNLRRSSADAFAIGSHISKTHRRWRRAQRLKRLEQPLDPFRTNWPLKIRTTEKGISGRPSCQAPLDKPCPASSDQRCQNGGYSSPKVVQDLARQGDSTDSDRSKIASMTSKHVSEPSTARRKDELYRAPGVVLRPKSLSEPSILPITPTIQRLLALAQHFHVFLAWPVIMNETLRDQLAQSYQERLPLAIADEGEMHALLAAGYYVNSLTNPRDRAVCFEKGLHHKIWTLAVLRHRLARPDYDQGRVFMVIRLLIALDFFSEDYDAAQLHQAAARKMISPIAQSSKGQRDMLLISDVWLAAALLRHTEFHVANWDPGARNSQAFDECLPEVRKSVEAYSSTIPRIPNKFLCHIFDDVHELVITKGLLTTPLLREGYLRHDVVLWLHRRSMALMGQLLNFFIDTTLASCQSSLPTAIKDPNSLLFVTVALGVALCLGALFDDVTCPQIPLERVAAVFKVKVVKLTQRSLCGDAEVEADLLLWLLFMHGFHDHRMVKMPRADPNDESTGTLQEGRPTWTGWFYHLCFASDSSNLEGDDAVRLGGLARCSEDVKRRLKRSLYLGQEMDEYLLRCFPEFISAELSVDNHAMSDRQEGPEYEGIDEALEYGILVDEIEDSMPFYEEGSHRSLMHAEPCS